MSFIRGAGAPVFRMSLYLHFSFFSYAKTEKKKKIDEVALLVADPLCAISTTDTDTRPLGYGDHIVNLIFGCIDNRRNFSTGPNQVIWDSVSYIAMTFEPIIWVVFSTGDILPKNQIVYSHLLGMRVSRKRST